MIVRIMAEGQHDVPDSELDHLNVLDAAVERAVEAGDPVAFTAALQALLARVREVGTPLPDDVLTPSALVLPSPDATIEEVQHLFERDGLVPG